MVKHATVSERPLSRPRIGTGRNLPRAHMQRQSVGLSHWKVADVGNILALAITSKSPLYPQPRPTRCSIGARKQSAAAGGLPFFWLSTAISCSRLVHSIHVMIIGNSLGSARARKRSYLHHRGCAPCLAVPSRLFWRAGRGRGQAGVCEEHA